MSEHNQEKQEGQKTIVSFVVGLLVGGLLVWVFSTPEAAAPTVPDSEEGTATEESTTDTRTDSENGATNNQGRTTDSVRDTVSTDKGAPSEPIATLPVGDGSVSVSNQPASNVVALSAATFPVSEGWIGVRDYANGQLGAVLGVVRFSEEQGLVPEEIILQRATTPGRDYAIVFYTENGDRNFSLADDVQIDEVFATFTAQ